MKDVVGNLKRLIEGTRARGIPVLFGPMAYTEEDYANHQLGVRLEDQAAWHQQVGMGVIRRRHDLFYGGHFQMVTFHWKRS